MSSGAKPEEDQANLRSRAVNVDELSSFRLQLVSAECRQIMSIAEQVQRDESHDNADREYEGVAQTPESTEQRKIGIYGF